MRPKITLALATPPPFAGIDGAMTPCGAREDWWWI